MALGHCGVPPSNLTHEENLMESAVWGLIGTIVGALASIGTSWIAARTSSNLQKRSNVLERLENARAFQRESLIALQDALNDCLRMTSRAHFEDKVSFAQSGKWGSGLLSEEVNEGILLTRRRVFILIERIANDNLRAELKALMGVSSELIASQNGTQAEALFVRMTDTGNKALENLGSVLRNLYEPQ